MLIIYTYLPRYIGIYRTTTSSASASYRLKSIGYAAATVKTRPVRT